MEEKEEAGLFSIPASNLWLDSLCSGRNTGLYLVGAAHWTALLMILRTLASKKTGLVS